MDGSRATSSHNELRFCVSCHDDIRITRDARKLSEIIVSFTHYLDQEPAVIICIIIAYLTIAKSTKATPFSGKWMAPIIIGPTISATSQT